MGFTKDGRRINVSVSSSPIYDAGGHLMSIAAVVRDITGRMRTQDALRENEEQFRTLFADAPVGIARVSPDGFFLQANAALCRILGYSEEELKAKSWLELTHPDDLDLSRLFHRSLPEANYPVAYEKRYVDKQGNLIPVRIRASLVRDAEASPRYFIIHVEDISESRQAKEALQLSEERWRMLFARNLAGVLRTSATGRILDCNQATALILWVAIRPRN
jgi:PAS domain S-box-containing protein